LTKPIKMLPVLKILSSILADATGAPSGNRKWDRSSLMGAVHPLRILVAEDNIVNQKVILRILEQIGYRADIAANGFEVLEALKRQQYDVVLMDLQMPEMDGREATRLIRNKRTGLKQPRIIALTAEVVPESQERARAMGMDDIVNKPIQLDELIGALQGCSPLSNSIEVSSSSN
jgi:CheY-like chemotaxis protein